MKVVGWDGGKGKSSSTKYMWYECSKSRMLSNVRGASLSMLKYVWRGV